MTDIQIAIGSLLAGAILSTIVTWFFFRKSVNKRLSAYMQYASPVLGSVEDPQVRKELEIRYRGQKVEDLLQLQFVVANEGQKAIRDLIEPLHVMLPKSAKLLEARVLYVQPTGREVTIKSADLPSGETRIDFLFNLLNRDEFFYVKLLLNGKLDAEKLVFRVTVDDLPPTLHPKLKPFRAPDDEPATGLKAIALGVIPLGLGSGSAFGMYIVIKYASNLLPGGVGFEWFSWYTLAMILWSANIVYWFARSLQLIFARGFFGPKHHFKLPYSVTRSDYPRAFDDESVDSLIEYRFLRDRVLHDDSLSPDEKRRLARRFMAVDHNRFRRISSEDNGKPSELS